MNIFPLEYNKNDEFLINWETSPESYDRLRLNKMILEYAQLLSAACNILSGKEIAPYKTTHTNHPCSVWSRQSKDNFERLLTLGIKTCETYTKREYRQHKSGDVIFQAKKLYSGLSFPISVYTKPPLAMPPEYKTEDIVASYRKYWISKPNMVYHEGQIPDWFEKDRKIPYKIKTDQGIIGIHKE